MTVREMAEDLGLAHPFPTAIAPDPQHTPKPPSPTPEARDPPLAPSDITKSYAKVLSPRMVNCKTSASTRDFSPSTIANLLRFRALGAYSYPTTMCGRYSPLSGMDSDLEAFSHYPADGSFAALPGQTAAKTNYLNQRFLSY
uniref:Uncharacterized protein n=1 Tax=Brassica campestris TaxID=3711 RepID=M4D100_BRACM